MKILIVVANRGIVAWEQIKYSRFNQKRVWIRIEQDSFKNYSWFVFESLVFRLKCPYWTREALVKWHSWKLENFHSIKRRN